MSTVTERIGAFVAELSYDNLPREVVEKTKVTLLHNLGVALAGRSLLTAPYRYARRYTRTSAGDSGARLLVDGTAVVPEAAAFTNAALMHARTQDDVYYPGLTHVGAATIPAALAVVDFADVGGRDLLTALVAGYETTAAISENASALVVQRGFRATGLFGAFGAAAATAKLLGGTEDEITNALGIAASFAAGLNQPWLAGSQEWQFQVAGAARNGLLAAMLAIEGGTGAPDAWEGEAGFHRSFIGGTTSANSVGWDLGSNWRSLGVTYKPYPVCALLQAPVTALVEVAEAESLTSDSVSRVRLCLTPSEARYPGIDSVGPFRDVGATLMSAQFCLSVALVEGTVRADDLRRLDDPALLDVARRVEIVADDTLGPMSNRLFIMKTDGSEVTAEFAANATTFNWDRKQIEVLVRSIQGEMPAQLAVDHLITAVLGVEDRPARRVIDACTVGGKHHWA